MGSQPPDAPQGDAPHRARDLIADLDALVWEADAVRP